MKRYFFLILLIQFAYAVSFNDLEKYLNNQDYSKVCNNKVFDYAVKKKDESLMNLYGIACLKSDYINKLSFVSVFLRETKESRENAVYFSTIIYKKKLLQAAIIDGMDISEIRLPKCDYILSDIYDLYVENKYIKNDENYEFIINNEKVILYTKKEFGFVKLIVEFYDQNKKIIKEYW